MTDDEYTQLALRSYTNPGKFTVYEFSTDLRRIVKLPALIDSYYETGDEAKVRMILNNIVITANCFGVKSTVEMIRHKTDGENRKIVDTCFAFLGWIDPIKSKIDQYFLDGLNTL